jgi:hypothetical protein
LHWERRIKLKSGSALYFICSFDRLVIQEIVNCHFSE